VPEPVSPELLRILACPVADCRAPLRAGQDVLVCTGCGRRYPVRDGIATLIPEEAIPPADGEAAAPTPAHVRDHQ